VANIGAGWAWNQMLYAWVYDLELKNMIRTAIVTKAVQITHASPVPIIA
jgi:hypothetical protein